NGARTRSLAASESVTWANEAPTGMRTRSGSASSGGSPPQAAAASARKHGARMARSRRRAASGTAPPVQERLEDQHGRRRVHTFLALALPLRQTEGADGPFGTDRRQALVHVVDREPGALGKALAEGAHGARPVALLALQRQGQADHDARRLV